MAGVVKIGGSALSVLALVAFAWVTRQWSFSIGPPIMPFLSQAGFLSAIMLMGVPVLTRFSRLDGAGDTRNSRFWSASVAWLHWYLLMVVLMNLELPSAQAVIFLGVSAAVGTGFVVWGRPAVTVPMVGTDDVDDVPQGRFDRAYPALVWAVALAFSALPLVDSTVVALFILTLAFGGGNAPLWGPIRARWPNIVLHLTGVAALVFALFTAA